MGNYSNFGNRSGGGRNFGGRGGGRAEMHDAVCDECGNDCKVPFRPSGDKPIYCSDCFEQKGGRDSGRSRGGRDSRGPSRGNVSDPNTARLAENIEVLNSKLDVIINLLSSPEKKKTKTVKAKVQKKKVKPVEKKVEAEKTE